MKTKEHYIIRAGLVCVCALAAGYSGGNPVETGGDGQKERASEATQRFGDASGENWGAMSEGFQLSLTFEKATFTNGEPILASVTLRNSSNRTLMYFISPHRKDMTVNLTRGDTRLVRKDLRPKPGASPEERLSYVTAGSTAYPKLAPGKERQFSMELNKMYDLTPGDYVAVAERGILKLSGEDVGTVVSSGKTKFRIVDSPAPNSASPNHRRENP